MMHEAHKVPSEQERTAARDLLIRFQLVWLTPDCLVHAAELPLAEALTTA